MKKKEISIPSSFVADIKQIIGSARLEAVRSVE